MIHQIGRKLRAQIHGFSGEVSAKAGKVARRFVEEMVYGILSRGSVRLTEVARALDEKITLHKTHDRLSRNLANPRLEDLVTEGVLQKGAGLVGKKSLLIVDTSDLIKKYAKKMEYLADVRDGSEQVLGRGYWIGEVVGTEVDSNRIVPLAQKLWSQEAEDFVSENDEVLGLVNQVRRATEGKGVLVLDRGGDRNALYKEWVPEASVRFLIRQRGDRHVLYKGKKRVMLELAEGCKTQYADTVVKAEKGKDRVLFIEFGFVPVRLPDHPERPLWLVVAKGFGRKPMMLLSTEPMRRNRKVLWWAVRAYIARWRVEETLRFIKQCYQYEDIRVMTYQRLRNLTALVLAAAFFTAVHLGAKTKLTVLALHALKAAKRLFGIPNFRYYAPGRWNQSNPLQGRPGRNKSVNTTK